MLLHSLSLQNIRSYVRQDFQFPQGSILLSGDIGAGKSSILLAIEFALFGAQRDGLSGESLLRKGAVEGAVQLHFHVGGKNVIIRRALKKSSDGVKQDAGFISIDGVRTDATPTELKTRILDLLGYPPELLTKSKALIYRYTVYTPQEQMKHIMEDQKSIRLDTLRRVFGIDKYKRVSDNAAIYLRLLKEDLRELFGRAADLPQKLAQEQRLLQSMTAVRQQLASLEEQLQQRQAIVRQRQEQLAQLEQQKQQQQQLQQQLDAGRAASRYQSQLLDRAKQSLLPLHERMRQTEEKLAGFSGHAAGSVEEASQRILQLEKKYAAALQQEAALRIRQESLSSQLSAINTMMYQKRDALRALLSLKDSLADGESMMARHQEDKARLPGYLEQLQKLFLLQKECETKMKGCLGLKGAVLSLEQCPTCYQPVSPQHKHAVVHEQDEKIAGYQEVLQQYDDGILELSCRIDAVLADSAVMSATQEQLARQQAGLSRIPGLQEDIIALQKQYTVVDMELLGLTEAFSKLELPTEEDLAFLEQEKAALLRLGEYHSLLRLRNDQQAQFHVLLVSVQESEAELVRLAAAASKLEAGLQQFASLLPVLAQAQASLDQARDGHHAIALQHAGTAKELDGVQRMLAELREEIARKQAVQSAIHQQRQVQSWMEGAFLPLVATIERHVLSKVYGEFNSLFQSWFSMLLDDEQIAVRLDDSFSPLIEQNGYEIAMDSLSGGEKTAIALAYRLSLNRVINSVVSTIRTKDIIILDEPTDGFSTEQLDKLRDVLDQLGTRQTIIVSHENKIEGFVDHVIRLQKEEHVSRVVG
ncbi:SMC family ATPase [Candidatus Woesearchaeota archaeon]|nr:SMC family ATPase [Candidatus Woesearchaeota archaeon]